eukprot:scaffold10149_cov91-Cylindrotheca_fusiformis.AAC.1
MGEWADRLQIVSDWSSIGNQVLDSAIGFVGERSPSSLRQAVSSVPFSGPLIGFVETNSKVRRRHFSRVTLPDSRWLFVRHADVSGVTTYRGFFLTCHLPLLALDGGVPMTLSAIIDHKVFLPVSPEDPALLTGQDRLPFDTPLSRILLHSRFSPTGFGARSLSPRELLLAWDFPLWAPPLLTRPQTVGAISGFPPLRILLQLADAALRCLSPEMSPVAGLPLDPLSSEIIPRDRSWIAPLSRWLPHDWIDVSLLTPKAAKADAAAVPSHLCVGRT